MKKILYVLALLLSVSAVVISQTVIEKNLARVKRVQGYYIFIQSEPVADYTVLGTVKKTGLVWSGQPDEMMKIIINRVQKDYPRADGIIFDDVSMQHATCVQFK